MNLAGRRYPRTLRAGTLASALLLLAGCDTAPCQELDDRCADCAETGCQDHAPADCVRGCKEQATLLSDVGCQRVLDKTAKGSCPYPLVFQSLSNSN